MAPLGFLQHKDSIVDLASLLQAHHADCPISNNTDPEHAATLTKVGDSAQVAFDNHTVLDDDHVEEEKDAGVSAVTSRPAAAAGPTADPTVAAASTLSHQRQRSLLVQETNQAYNDWMEFQNYYDYNGTGYAVQEQQRHKGNVMACLFPWLFASSAPSSDTAEEQKEEANHNPDESPKDTKIAKLSHLAAAAAAGPTPPGTDEALPAVTPSLAISPGLSTTTNDGSSGPDEDALAPAPTLKGILKMTKLKPNDGGNRASVKGSGKRSLFSTMYTQERNSSLQEKSNNTHTVEFSPMARVMSIQSSQTMTPVEKASVWWERQDYADFKKTARLVAKAMLQGGSEVWLMTNPSWKSSKGRGDSNSSSSCNRWGEPSEEQKEEPIGDKWWCKFGHSRRGLEHIASPEEGKERQRNVLQSKLAVIQEQKRQQRSHLWMDADRIRQVYVRYNSWSRELCLAAGASDAEAVRSNFRDQGRSRAFYLYKHRITASPTSNHVPDFMGRLQLQETVESIHEAPASAASMTKKAVGFGVEGHVNMSTVMSGMGV
jgi:hypothetical protein